MEAGQILVFANRFFQAYNDVGIITIGELISENLHWERHGRFKGPGKEKLLDQIQKLSEMVPGRHSDGPTRWAVNGDVISIEHKLHGTPVVDFLIFGWKAHEVVTLDCCSILVLRDGKIIEWSDYA